MKKVQTPKKSVKQVEGGGEGAGERRVEKGAVIVGAGDAPEKDVNLGKEIDEALGIKGGGAGEEGAGDDVDDLDGEGADDGAGGDADDEGGEGAGEGTGDGEGEDADGEDDDSDGEGAGEGAEGEGADGDGEDAEGEEAGGGEGADDGAGGDADGEAEEDLLSRVPAGVAQEIRGAGTVDELRELRGRYERMRDFAEDNEEGYEEDKGDGETKEWTAAEMRRLRRNMERAVEATKVRIGEVKRVAEVEKKAVLVYPDYSKKGSDLVREYDKFLKAVPGASRYAGLRVLIGDAMAGRRAREEAARKKKEVGDGRPGKPVKKVVKVPAGGQPGVSLRRPLSGAEGAAKKKAAMVRLRQSGGDEASLAAAIEEGLD